MFSLVPKVVISVMTTDFFEEEDLAVNGRVVNSYQVLRQPSAECGTYCKLFQLYSMH